MSLTLNKQSLALMNTFETVTHTKVVDCFDLDGSVYFVVPDTTLGKAIGKGARHVHLLRKKLNKDVKIIEYKSDVLDFIKSLISPVKCEIIQEDHTIVLKTTERKTKALLIGRSAKNLHNLTTIVKRHFDVECIVVQ